MADGLHPGRYRSLQRLHTLAAIAALAACGPASFRHRYDQHANAIVQVHQRKALGRNEPLNVEKPSDTLRRRLIAAQVLPTAGPESIGSDALPKLKHWPEKDYPRSFEDPDGHIVDAARTPLRLSLVEALQVAAKNSREYQDQKEAVFRAALDLEQAADEFRNTFTGSIETVLTHDRTGSDPLTGVKTTPKAGLSRRFKSGATLASNIGIDIVQLLSSGGTSSLGLVADASITIPLLRGSGREIVTEPLTQAQRNVIYALWTFERFKRSFAVRVVSDYLSVLQTADQVENAAKNYQSQVLSVRRSTEFFSVGQLTRIQLDQARTAELNARENWISARKRFDDRLDTFKQTLGLPSDAQLQLDPRALAALSARYAGLDSGVKLEPEGDVPPADAPIVLPEPSHNGAGPLELDERQAIVTALDNRLDLRVDKGRVYDEQRGIVVAADALRAGLDITGVVRTGESRSVETSALPDARLRPERGFYTLGARLDLPWERTREALDYRRGYLALETAIRNTQQLEDQIKSQIRETLRRLVEARESYTINKVAVGIAEQRVDQARLSLELARPGVQIRDVLEAEADLLRARNSLSASLVDYRVAELELQRDMDVLDVNEKGLINEYNPAKTS